MTLRLKAVYAYALPLAHELVVGDRRMRERGGLLAVLEDRDGRQGIGEIAPLPGLHREAEADCLAALIGCRAALGALEFASGGGAALIRAAIFRSLSVVAERPPVHFGLAMAALTLRANALGWGVERLLGEAPAASVPVNGLVAASPCEWLREARRLTEEGCRVLKIKVGRTVWADELRAIRAVLDDVGGRVRLVLDGNRAWRFDEAERFLACIDRGRICYAEELLANPAELVVLGERTGVPMALDETLAEADAHAELIRDWPWIYVLKPDRMAGSVETCLRLADAAHRRGQDVVVSSSFLAPPGLAFLACLGSALHCPHAGLDTPRGFADARCAAAIRVIDGCIAVRDCHLDAMGCMAPYVSMVWSE